MPNSVYDTDRGFEPRCTSVNVNYATRSYRLMVSIPKLCILSLCIGIYPLVHAIDETSGFRCVNAQCIYTLESALHYAIIPLYSCLQTCPISNHFDAFFTIRSSKLGTCTDCTLVATPLLDFSRFFQSMAVTVASLMSDQCMLSASVQMDVPSQWTVSPSSTLECMVENILVPCSITANVSTLEINKHVLTKLFQKTHIPFQLGPVSTRRNPGSLLENNRFILSFQSQGCLTLGERHPLAFTYTLHSDSYDLIGQFTNTKLIALQPKLLQLTLLRLSFRNGAILGAQTRFVLQIADTMQAKFTAMMENASSAILYLPNSPEIHLQMTLTPGKLSMQIPDTFSDSIPNGQSLALDIYPVRNPVRINEPIDFLYLMALQGDRLAVDTSPFPFYTVQRGQRQYNKSKLDIASIGVFGGCFLLSIGVVIWHGITLSMSTFWTDTVAISVLLSFLVACGGATHWILYPSSYYIYWFTTHYVLTSIMILSLCFHWVVVLSFKGFKNLTFKSPVLLTFLALCGIVLAFVVVTLARMHGKIECAFHTALNECDSQQDCDAGVPVHGHIFRQAVDVCALTPFFDALAAGFILHTILLLILGCFIMSRGRQLLRLEAPMKSHVCRSLAVFYTVIATTCVLYLGSQIAYFVDGMRSASVDVIGIADTFYYVLIVWLPNGLPPLLFLFLQWNPTRSIPEEDWSLADEAKDQDMRVTPRSTDSSPTHAYWKPVFDMEPSPRSVRLCVRLQVPMYFDRACFLSLDYDTEPCDSQSRALSRASTVVWNCIGTTEMAEKEDGQVEFSAVMHVPVVSRKTTFRFQLHVSTLGCRSSNRALLSWDSKDETSEFLEPSTQLPAFLPCLEFHTTSEAVMDAKETLLLSPERDSIRPNLSELEMLIDQARGSIRLGVQTVSTLFAPKESTVSSGNLTRCFQYIRDDKSVGLVVEDLKESAYANMIPRQFLELLCTEYQRFLERARQDLQAFISMDKRHGNRTLIGQIQGSDDAVIVQEWLQRRVETVKTYLEMLHAHRKLLTDRDARSQFFKSSVEKKHPDLRFLPVNLHIQDFVIGSKPENPPATYAFTTVGAFAAHCLKFSRGGILSFQLRLSKMETRSGAGNASRWTQDARAYHDLMWELSMRVDVCFSQALTALVATFAKTVNTAIQSENIASGEVMLEQLSVLGYLFHVESLLSTHGREIGMLEDMAGAMTRLENVVFQVYSIGEAEAARVAKIQVLRDKERYVVQLGVMSHGMRLPEKTIAVTPVLFTQGINEMQTIANNTERTKTELQDLININNLKPLRAYCGRYCSGSSDERRQWVEQEFRLLEASVVDAASSLVKSKRPEILQRSADLCREMSGGRVTVCKSAKDRTAMSVTLEQVRILHRHHGLPAYRMAATVSVMRSHGVRVENAFKNTGKRQFAFNKLQRSLLPEEYRCPDQVSGANVS
uniref:Inositol3 putative n=1 Tax=Albugo laibachii Nc14 TaxID=890382 RepID=F0WQ44_9STRA|nr:inositol3 putative [Albugo laibachii Nc14]|eukprot:CCA23449.1 inositol3 putative [Albugo laibachii Nc14]